MEYWLNGVGKDRYPPTWEGLYMLLEDAQYEQVAEELKKTVDETTATVSADKMTTTSLNASVDGAKEAYVNDETGNYELWLLCYCQTS